MNICHTMHFRLLVLTTLGLNFFLVYFYLFLHRWAVGLVWRAEKENCKAVGYRGFGEQASWCRGSALLR